MRSLCGAEAQPDDQGIGGGICGCGYCAGKLEKPLTCLRKDLEKAFIAGHNRAIKDLARTLRNDPDIDVMKELEERWIDKSIKSTKIIASKDKVRVTTRVMSGTNLEEVELNPDLNVRFHTPDGSEIGNFRSN